MQNLVSSELGSSTSEVVLCSIGAVWLTGGFSLGDLTDLTATIRQITIAATMIVKKIGASEIRFSDIGMTGCTVGGATLGELVVVGSLVVDGTGVGVLEAMVGLGLENVIPCKFGTYWRLSSISYTLAVCPINWSGRSPILKPLPVVSQ